ncbi:MAG: YetF domain-containing protein [Balneolaceae bacterium]
MFFEDWHALLQVFVSALIAYVALIISLRISGKRTLAKWNAFDFVMTIALGSILASVILIEDVTLSEGVLAFVLLITFQYIITWLTVRTSFVRRLIKSNPTLLFNKGQFLNDALKSQRVTKSEVMAAIRESGILSFEDVEAVVLETDGSFSVMGKSENSTRSSLNDVE